ncbi:hypothetical protein cypCar_00037679 [Cyprinus carpio]|nr:hypothetical protein cypCar_00037679 [Cyprinus carpio]
MGQDKITSSSFIGTFMQQLNKREQTMLEGWRLINEKMSVLKEELEDKLNEEALAEGEFITNHAGFGRAHECKGQSETVRGVMAETESHKFSHH